ncbi:hypothetical protein BGZ63DRAFT_423288 [Mariannaea sp. PMI_226]|nr:hypothetical protein BGZ63DRAFT_423288 [Mariannaea sp. PMI_226]
MAESAPASLPWLNTDTSRDGPPTERLIIALSETLQIPREDIELFDSFTDLGGDAEAAVAFHDACLRKGIDVRVDDILNCHTLAELQTRMTPLSPASETGSPATGSTVKATTETVVEQDLGHGRLTGSSGVDSAPSSMSISATDIFSTRPASRGSVSSYGSASTTMSSYEEAQSPTAELKAELLYTGQDPAAKPNNNSAKHHGKPTAKELERLVQSNPRVRNVCVVTPRAGPFDGQLVALVHILSLSHDAQPQSYSLSEDDGEACSLPPLSQLAIHKLEIRSLRIIAAQEWAAEIRRPQIWIPLQHMAELEDGKPNSRKIQTWVQNMGQDLYTDAMKLQLPEPRRRAESTLSKVNMNGHDDMSDEAMSSWAVWKGDGHEDDELDDMECFPLAPMQRLFFETSTRHVNESTDPGVGEPELRFTHSMMLRVEGGDVKEADLEAAVEALVARHGMLRARFRPIGDYWVQVIIPQTLNAYRLSHHYDLSEEGMASLIDAAQSAINPADGPVFAVEHFKNDKEQLIYLVAHNLVVDPMSWRILVHDLDELLRKGSLLSEGSISFPHWVDYQDCETTQRLFEPTLPFEVHPAALDYWGLEEQPNSHFDSQQSSFSLSGDLSLVLQKVCTNVLRTDTADVFLAALLLSFRQTFPDRAPPTLWKREHGRSAVHADFNIMETVGWFTSLCPIGVSIDPLVDIVQAIKFIKDTRRAIPRDGIPFFTSQFSTSDGASSGVPVEVMLNWTQNEQVHHPGGILEPVLLPGQTVAGPKSDTGPQVGRIALFEVSARIDASGIAVDFVHNKNSARQDKIRLWRKSFESLLLEAITKLRYHEPELTLSDVPLLRTSYEALARLGSDRASGSGLPSVRDIETIYPINPAQQEILIAQTKNMDAFHVHSVYELRLLDGNPVDTTRLCKAWEAIVANKPALRSIFIDGVSKEGLFDQVVLKKISPNMLFIDSKDPERALSKLPSLKTSLTEPRHRLSVCQTELKTLVRIDASQTISDLTSTHNLVLELCRVYSNNSPTHNDALHRTYLYHMASLDTAYSLQIWKTNLLGIKPCIMPFLNADTGEQVSRPHPFTLSVTRKELDAFCQEAEIDPTALLQLAWALVLRAFVGLDQVVFGYQFSGRDEQLLHGIGGAIGSFANILPCVVDLTTNQTIKKCLYNVDDSFTTAQKHRYVTMAEVQHALSMREGPFFNTCFFFQESDPLATAAAATVLEDDESPEVHPVEISSTLVTSSRQTDCDVSCTAMFVNDVLHANLSSVCLSNKQAMSILISFDAAIKQIMNHPTRLIAEVNLSTEENTPQLSDQDWEPRQMAQKMNSCLHDVILRHGQLSPDDPAVSSWDGDLTYIQLATLVARLRTYLVNLGVGPGTIVPVVLEKTCWAPVMLLAVLQAGASFVALDGQDQATVKATIRYLDPTLVMSTESGWKELGPLVLNLLVINQAFFATLPPRMSALTREATPDHAACVMVTPKKTSAGTSRSIFFTHASLCTTFAAQGPALKLNSDSRVLQLSAFNVDISLVEVLGTLFHGGCICIPSPKDRLNDLEGSIARMSVNWSYMTGVLARKLNPPMVPTLKTLCFRTRKLDVDTFGPWLENRSILLAYGAPDICPLGISITEVTKEKDMNIITPPLVGRFWILNPDDSRKMMPMGSIGELAIDSPLITPHRFVKDSVLVAPSLPPATPSDKHKAKYLKTGHRVRYLEDGNFQFISSARDDVFVGGSAVDVALVEQKIRRCLGPGVDVVVDKIATKDSIRVLAAFLQLGEALFHGQEGFQNVSLRVKERTFIAKKLFEVSLDTAEHRLPEHSVPAVFIPLKDLPMSTSLKINRRALFRLTEDLTYAQLQEMSAVPNAQEIQRVVLGQKPLPLTGPEELMRSIWAKVLSISPADIKRTSSFFSVGGNRFLAAELLIACRKLGLRVSLSDIFKELSLVDMCGASDPPEQHPAAKTAMVNKTSPVTGFDFKFVMEVIVPQLNCSVQDVLDVTEATSEQMHGLELGMFQPRADITCYVLQFNSRVSPEKLEVACEALTKLHPVLRTAFVTHESRTYQVLCGGFKPVFQRCSCPHSRLELVTEKLVRQHQNIQFQPAVPVTGFTYLDTAEQGALIIRLSKSQVDEASAPLLVQHLVSLYEESKGMPTATSFFEYTRAAGMVAQTEGLEYWTSQLEGAKITEIVSYTAPHRPTSEVRKLQEVVRVGSIGQYSITPDTIVKAAWSIVLSTISGIDDVVFGEVVPGHNVALPNKTDLVSLVGPIANTIPVRVRFPSQHSTPMDLMKYIQRQRRANCRFESLGIHELVRNRCADWPFWKRFSSVVHHRTVPLLDGTATYNMGGTTFTYKSIDPEVRALPDMLISSKTEGSERIRFEMEFPLNRVDLEFAQDCMRLLVAAVETLTHRDTLNQPMLASAEEIRRFEKRVPLPMPATTEPVKPPCAHLLYAEQRRELETAISEGWAGVVANPLSQGIPQEQIHQTPLYKVSSSLLTTHHIADSINKKLSKTGISGISDAGVLSAEDVIDNPTMQAQLELIARRLHEGGLVTLSIPHQKVTNLRPKTQPMPTSSGSTSSTGSNNSNNYNNGAVTGAAGISVGLGIDMGTGTGTSTTITSNNNSGGITHSNSTHSATSNSGLSWRESIRMLRGKESIRGLSVRSAGRKKSKEQDTPKMPSPPRTSMSSSIRAPVDSSGEVVPELMAADSQSTVPESLTPVPESLPTVLESLPTVPESVTPVLKSSPPAAEPPLPKKQTTGSQKKRHHKRSSSTAESTGDDKLSLSTVAYTDVSTFSPATTDDHKSRWTSIWDKARPMTPRGIKGSGK